jgi:hypothetical protein
LALLGHPRPATVAKKWNTWFRCETLFFLKEKNVSAFRIWSSRKCKRLQNKINYVKLCEKVDFVFNSWYNIYERLGETYEK